MCYGSIFIFCTFAAVLIILAAFECLFRNAKTKQCSQRILQARGKEHRKRLQAGIEAVRFVQNVAKLSYLTHLG